MFDFAEYRNMMQMDIKFILNLNYEKYLFLIVNYFFKCLNAKKISQL